MRKRFSILEFLFHTAAKLIAPQSLRVSKTKTNLNVVLFLTL
jgi:hypothetical protein